MRDRPQGLLRWLFRAPVWLYRARLGFLLGSRFLMIEHRGRRSGRSYQTVVEVVGRPAADIMLAYETQHPKVATVLQRELGLGYDGTAEGRVEMIREIPMVGFTPRC